VFAYAQIGGSKNVDNKIDDITTARQIEDLLRSLNPVFSTFHVNDSMLFLNNNCKTVSDSLHCSPWFKADFDNNGYTDLMVTGGWDNHAVFCILDSGNNHYSIDRLTRKIFQNCTFPVLKKIGKDNLLLYYSVNEEGCITIDTLIYKFGDFVNYHSSSKNNNIKKIEFVTHECFGECPQFKLIIDSNRNAQYEAIKYNKTYGDFEGMINEDNFDQLIQLLNYIDFTNLKNKYSVSWNDDQNCTLTITYDNGKIKTIDDDGMHGTFGLERVYQILFGWRDNQQWSRILPGEKRTERTSE
jgi:hypothetical protein